MVLILNNDDIQKALDVRECLAACEDAYLELAASRAVNRPTTQSYLPHRLPRSTYSFKSVEGGIAKFGVLALRITSAIYSANSCEFAYLPLQIVLSILLKI